MSDNRIIMVTHNLWKPLIGYMTASELKDGGMLENIGLARVGEPRQKKSPIERCPVVLHLFQGQFCEIRPKRMFLFLNSYYSQGF